MTNNLREFLKKANSDETLAKKLGALNREEDRAVVIQKAIEIAREAGIELTEADFAETEGEMDDEELMAVSGGWKVCVCVVGGGGRTDKDGDFCICVAGGAGERLDDGPARCFCAYLGGGYKGL